MSLATRCPACGTIFRVVQDQLKVSEGWVRCGQCHEVFHGIEALFDLDSDPTIAARRSAARQPAAAPPPTRVFAQQRANAPIPPLPPAPEPAPPAPVQAPAPVVFAPKPAAPPTAPQSVPATPSVFGSPGGAAPAPAPIRPGYTGFTPATRPMPPAPERPPATSPAASPVAQVTTRTTIAPRFAARLAEEAARAQAIAAASQPPAIVVTSPVTSTPPAPQPLPSAPVPTMPPAAPLSVPSAPVPPFQASTPAPLATTPMPLSAPPAAKPPVSSPAPVPFSAPPPATTFRATIPASLATPSAPAPFSLPTEPEPIDFDLGLDAPSALPGHFAPTVPMSLDALTELAPLVPLSPPPQAARPSAPMPFGAPSAPVPFGGRASAPVPLGTPSAPAPFDFARRAEEAASRWQTQPMSLPPRTQTSSPPPAPASWFAPPGTPASTTPAPAPMSVPEAPPGAAAVPDVGSPPPADPAFIPPSIAARRAAAEPPPAPPSKAEIEPPLVPPIVEQAPAPSASQRAADFAAPPPSDPVPAEPSVIGEFDEFRELGDLAAVEVVEPAPEVGGSTMPSRLADDLEEERRAGPPTLASMLPEDAGEWPPRKTKKRKDKDAVAGATESVLVDKTKDPRFLREARSGARWRRPWVRAMLSLLLLGLVVAAVAQVAWPLRDTIAARWPATQPVWAWICEQADCKIEAPRSIASLALDGSSLTRTDTEHVLLFSADLHNRADHEVLMPSFDVSFMDLNGAIVARKVLSPEQLGIHQASLPALGELHVHARLQVGTLPASGFQADLFYP